MKKRIRKTGEIVDVMNWTELNGDGTRNKRDYVSYIDSNGEEHVNVKGLNLSWDFEDVEEKPTKWIDWERRRYETAKAIMNGFLSNGNAELTWGEEDIDDHAVAEVVARQSVLYADYLIAELKKGGEK